ncbi:MAG: DUF6394 family protein [Comamonadaceae bacterium]|nr:DUF6394 family protein [Comamonadaceae bacterium]
MLKFGDRTQIGAVHLSTSLVADLQLIAAAITWAIAVHVTGVGMTAARHLQRRLAVRRRAVRQHRLGHHPDRRNRHAAPLSAGGSVNSVFFLVLRRMRAPLIAADRASMRSSVLGLTLVPGVGCRRPAGAAAEFLPRLLLHQLHRRPPSASARSPTAFSDAQRLWVTVCIYLTVVGWSYSIVTLLALLQDKGFQNTLVASALRAGACGASRSRSTWSAAAARPAA